MAVRLIAVVVDADAEVEVGKRLVHVPAIGDAEDGIAGDHHQGADLTGARGEDLIGQHQLAVAVDPRFVWLPMLMGAGLIFAGVSGLCPMMNLVARLPWNRASQEAGPAKG